MNKTFILLMVILLLCSMTFAQNSGKVISAKANLRGTPESNGRITARITKGQTFQILNKRGKWFLVQTPDNVGWISGYAIALIESDEPPKLSNQNSIKKRSVKAKTQEPEAEFPIITGKWGVPNNLPGNSNGPGAGGGIGSGRATGQGNGNGTGAGNGNGSGFGNGNGNSNEFGLWSPSGWTQPLKIISKPKPAYTSSGRRDEVQGTVILRVTFLASGEIGAISPVKGLPKGLTGQAIAAARSIKFEPAKSNGVRITVTKQIEYTFSIY